MLLEYYLVQRKQLKMPKFYIQDGVEQTVLHADNALQACFFAIKYRFEGIQLLSRKVKLLLNHHYHTLLQKFLINSPEVRGHTNQITFGSEYEIGEYDLVFGIRPFVNLSTGIKSTSIYSRVFELEKETTYNFAATSDFGAFILKISPLENEPFEKIAFEYFDFIAWAKSHLDGESYRSHLLMRSASKNIL